MMRHLFDKVLAHWRYTVHIDNNEMFLTWSWHLCDLVVACFWQSCKINLILLRYVFNSVLAAHYCHINDIWHVFDFIMTLIRLGSDTLLTSFWPYYDKFVACFWHYFGTFLTQLCQSGVKSTPKMCQNSVRSSPEQCQNDVMMVSDACQNCVKMVPKCCQKCVTPQSHLCHKFIMKSNTCQMS